MKKYNLSEIMKNAWVMFRKHNAGLGTRRDGRKIIRWSFASCLKKAWDEAKDAIKSGLRRMHYSGYKNNYSECETVSGSYDKSTKTIEVLTLVRKGFKRIDYGGPCPRCHTYCYGDCMAR